MNKNIDKLLKIFEALAYTITLVNDITLIINKYHPKTMEEFYDAINEELKIETISKNN